MAFRLGSLCFFLFIGVLSPSAAMAQDTIQEAIDQGKLLATDAALVEELRKKTIAIQAKGPPYDYTSVYDLYRKVETTQFSNLSFVDVLELKPHHLLAKLNSKSQSSFLTGYYQYLQKSSAPLESSPVFSKGAIKTSNPYVSLTLPLEEKLKIYESLKKAAYYNFHLNTSAELLESIFREMLKNPAAHPDLVSYFLSHEAVAKMFFEKPAFDLAVWQIEQAFPLKNWEKESLLIPNRANSIRQRVDALSSYLGYQFGSSISAMNNPFTPTSVVKNRVMNHVEERMQTSLVESLTRFGPYRHYWGMPEKEAHQYSRVLSEELFPHSYSPTAYLRIDSDNTFPRRVSTDQKKALRDAFGKRATMEYIAGITSELPKIPIDSKRNAISNYRHYYREKWAENYEALKVWRREISEATQNAKISVFTELLERGAPEYNELRDMLLGNKSNDPIYQAFFDAYYQAIPRDRRNFFIAKLVASYREEDAGFSLRRAFEANGPGSKKFGQTLYSTRLAPADEMAELKLLLDRAEPPERIEYLKRISELFEHRLVPEPLHSVSGLAGSGSVNYGVRAQLIHPITKKQIDVIIRFQRDGVHAIVDEEIKVYDEMFKNLMEHPNSEVRRAAAKANTAWQGASKTLRGGEQAIELDLEIERKAYPEVKKTYSRSRSARSGFKIEVGKPLEEFQVLLPDEMRKRVAIYEFVPNVKWEHIQDQKLRKALVADLLEAEMDSILAGNFDKDGHAGNWLVDLENKRLVRIDYAQFQNAPKEELDRFLQAFKINARPFAKAGDAKNLHSLLPEVFEAENLSAVPVENLQKWMAQDEFKKMLPHEKFFYIRDQLEKVLGYPVTYKSTANDVLIAMSKLQGFEEYIGKEKFKQTIGKKLFTLPEKLGIALNNKLCDLTSWLRSTFPKAVK